MVGRVLRDYAGTDVYKRQDEGYAELWGYATRLEGLIRNVGVHAAGVVIGCLLYTSTRSDLHSMPRPPAGQAGGGDGLHDFHPVSYTHLSTSMASVCAGTMSLLAAGVPLKRPVAGISVGLVPEQNDQHEIPSYKMCIRDRLWSGLAPWMKPESLF